LNHKIIKRDSRRSIAKARLRRTAAILAAAVTRQRNRSRQEAGIR